MRLLLVPLLLSCLAACGDRAEQPRSQDGAEEFIARATVLEDASHGPQLCLGPIAESYPPQCGGPDLVGWDWAKVDGFEKSGKARWGEYVVIGSYNAAKNTFSVTHSPVLAVKFKGKLPAMHDPTPPSTPCKKPAGGWRVIDPSLTTERSMEQAIRTAEARRDFGGVWLDQSINPADRGEITEEKEKLLNDPKKLILNVAVTGDPLQAEADLRKVWGGSLCVSRSKHTQRELQQTVDEITRTSDRWLSAGAGDDVVEVEVVWDDGTLQHTFDRRYGRGTVKVNSALQPYRS